jgi:hypothetical protein
MNPGDFSFHLVPVDRFNPPAVELRHRSGFRFLFMIRDVSMEERARSRTNSFGLHSVMFEPGEEAPAGYAPNRGWANVLELFNYWLRRIVEEIEAPDLWASLRADAQAVQPPRADAANTPFTADEQRQVREALSEFMRRVEERQLLTGRQLEDLSARMNYVAGAVDRLGRLDWKEIFISGLVGYMISQTLDPDTARALFHIGVSVLRPIFPELFGDPGPILLPPDIGTAV